LELKHLAGELQPNEGNREDAFIAKGKELELVAPAGVENKLVGRKVVTHDHCEMGGENPALALPVKKEHRWRSLLN
jgi:hypothetical protein